MKISVGICTHNEGHHIEHLLAEILGQADESKTDIEIVVVDDYSIDPYTLNVFTKFKDYIKFFTHSLNGNFAAHKNYMNAQCTGDWILNLDADESLPLPFSFLEEIVALNPKLDLVAFPRLNRVDGLTLRHIQQWGWNVTGVPGWEASIGTLKDSFYTRNREVIDYYNLQIDGNNYLYPAVQWPDYQGRFYKRAHAIFWENRVHERITGAQQLMTLPAEMQYAIHHIKSIRKQEEQNSFYTTIV